MILLELFLGFLKIGCFAFGGAYGAIPLIRDVVLSYGWLTDDAVTYMIAVSESTPGPIMINLATYVGSSRAGLAGAIVATFGVVLPSFIIILLIASVMKGAIKNKYVQAVLRGLKPCIIGVICATGLFMILNNALGLKAGFVPDFKAIIITAVAAAAYMLSPKFMKKKISPITLMLISAVLGCVVYGV